MISLPKPIRSFSRKRKSLLKLSSNFTWNVMVKSRSITLCQLCTTSCPSDRVSSSARSASRGVSTASTAYFQRKDTADRIAQRLTEEGHSVASLHGDKMTNERDGILDAFRDGKTKVLITTNVVARGIDIQQVNMVVNYDVPDLGPSGDYKPDIETYIHRIGQLPLPSSREQKLMTRSNWSIWTKRMFSHFRP